MKKRSGDIFTIMAMACAVSTGTWGLEYRSIDGTGNNIDNPSWGSVNTHLLRQSAVGYSDSISAPAGSNRASPRSISNAVGTQISAVSNNRNLSSFVWQWGQFLDHDISITESASPTEAFHIPVPTGDAFFDPMATGTQTIEFNRSIYDTATGSDPSDPRQQINQITAWIDASHVYGSDTARANALRSSTGGRLATSPGDYLPFNTSGLHNAGGPGPDLFLAGDIRANEQVGLTAMHTLFVREHNRRADQIAATNPSLNDEEIYQRARKIVGATVQQITYGEFLPAILGNNAISSYSGYKSSVNGSISNEFSTAAFRFGHTMLPSKLLRRDYNRGEMQEGDIALLAAFFNPTALTEMGLDPYLMGFSMQQASEIDNQVIDDVRNFLFGPPGSGGFDLASLNIQRGRDHGLAHYNQMRIDFGLDPVSSFADITSDLDLQAALASVYKSVDDIDAWIGGLAEDHLLGSSLGELFTAIIADQFTRLRDGDRFWYENDAFFKDEENTALLEEIENITLADIIELNTGISGLQDNVFFADQVPLPASLWLLGSGLIGIGAVSRRRNQVNFD